jgi:hypothetical protein
LKRIERAIVVTTINPPTRSLRELASRSDQWPVIIIGDNKTPTDWALKGATFISIDEQRERPFALRPLLPENHYSRKNLGYLEALSLGATTIAETDDDNFVSTWPPQDLEPNVEGVEISQQGWVNVYDYFTDERIWARGFPLQEIRRPIEPSGTPSVVRRALIHQYLAEGDPDVDAIYRMTVGKTDHIFRDRIVILAPGSLTPFNSQSTVWYEGSLPFLYLPSFVNFRMTDIWRSYIAQVCLWASDERIAYRSKGVYQERNEHNLFHDFLDELVGYQRNKEIMDALVKLRLSSEPSEACANLLSCYVELSRLGVLPNQELTLVQAWITDLTLARKMAGARDLEPN